MNKHDEDSSRAQHARFIETARKLGCDKGEEATDEKLKVIARHKPKSELNAPEEKE